VGNVTVHKGNAADMGGFKHMRMGYELARPTVLPDGTQAFTTPTGKTYTLKKMSS
jgi:hypothetical protein